jgi:hypothetical protein
VSAANPDEVDLARWRGIATDPDADRSRAEDADPAAVARLRVRSRTLLRNLLRPHRRRLGLTVGLLLTQNAAAGRTWSCSASTGDRAAAGRRRGPADAVAGAFWSRPESVRDKRGSSPSAEISRAVLLQLRRQVCRHFLRLRGVPRALHLRPISRLTSAWTRSRNSSTVGSTTSSRRAVDLSV